MAITPGGGAGKVEVAGGGLVGVGGNGVAVGAGRTSNNAVTGVEAFSAGRLYHRMNMTVAKRAIAKKKALAITQGFVIERNQSDNFKCDARFPENGNKTPFLLIAGMPRLLCFDG